MLEEKINQPQPNQPGDPTPSSEYIKALDDVKKNMIPKDEYQKLLTERNELITALKEGSNIELEEPKNVNIQELRNRLFDPNAELSNLEYIKTALELREAVKKETGQDIFVGNGEKYAPTQADYEGAERVANIFKECIEYANGDSQIFTQELQRRTNDVAPQIKRR